jgi:hypothetical protein
MRATFAVLLLCLAVSASAREWKNAVFHCAANIPDSAGWQMIESPQVPGIAPVLVMQNSARQAVFGISVVEKYHDANLADVAGQKDLEAMLRQCGYQFVGHSTVRDGGLDWLQYPVRAGAGAQQVSGVIRYTSAGGYLFSITMLRGGGQEASQDVELVQAARSFRVLPLESFAAAPAPAAPSATATTPPAGGEHSAKTDAAANPEAAAETPEDESTASRNRMIWLGGAGLLVLLLFFSIIGGGTAKKR